jgi:prepilin peptidase dependent protein B
MLTLPRPFSRNNLRGFTLVEMMIGIVVGFIVLAGVIAVFLAVVRSSAYVARESRLNQELRTAMDLMVNDIRRAGYWRNARPYNPDVDDDLVFNPFMNRIEIPSGPDQPADYLGIRDIHIHNGSCILFSYDTTFSTDPSVFGYRLNGAAIEMLIGSDDTSDPDSCSTLGWQPITSPAITVSNLDFSFHTPAPADADAPSARSSQCLNTRTLATFESPATPDVARWTPPCELGLTDASFSTSTGQVLLEARQITITAAATHARAPDTSLTLRDTVTVRNDRILRVP